MATNESQQCRKMREESYSPSKDERPKGLNGHGKKGKGRNATSLEPKRQIRSCLSLCTLDNAWGCIIFIFVCLSPIVASLAYLFAGHIRAHLGYVTKFKDTDVFAPDGRKIYRVVYFGDSLIEMSDSDFGWITHQINDLQTKWPKVAFDAYGRGIGGNGVIKLLSRVQKDVVAHHPDCIILYFDTDASDPNDSGTDAYKSMYEANMATLLGILTSCTPCVGFGGPTIYGEYPRGSGLNPRDDVYEDYVKINEKLSAKFNVSYFHTRDAFFSAEPPGWFAPSGFLTKDGEHHSAQGTAIVAKIFLDFLVRSFSRIIGPPDF